MNGPDSVLYVVSLKPDAGYESKFNEWYDTEHVPELLSCPGFLSARRFQAIEGAPEYLAIYEVSSMEAFRGEKYLGLAKRGDSELSSLARDVRLHKSRELNAKYREILRRGQ